MPVMCFTDLPPTCPFCDEHGRPVGTRNRRDHWLCAACGLRFETPRNRDPTERSDGFEN
jgi:transcription elongation factor Elf1